MEKVLVSDCGDTFFYIGNLVVIWKDKSSKNTQYFLVYSMDNKYIAHAWANLNSGSIRKQIYLKKDKH